MRSLLTAGFLLGSVSTLALVGCGGGGASADRNNRGRFEVTQISTGHGQVYPYRIRTIDSLGNPTTEIVNVESDEILHKYVAPGNGVLPIATWPTEAILPDGSRGNHYLHIRFSHDVEVGSILSNDLANASTNSGLTTAVTFLEYDQNTERTITVRGRGFVGGQTYVNRGGVLELVQAVVNSGGTLKVVDPIAEGFPAGFSNDVDLVDPKSFVFVADVDGRMTTIEAFDPLQNGFLYQVQVTNAVRDYQGALLNLELCTATTVGTDSAPPQVSGYTSVPQISPGNSQTGVDPTLPIRVTFNKPVQPRDLGVFFTRTNLVPGLGGIALDLDTSQQTFPVIYYADPVSFADFCNYIITPAYSLPGGSVVSVRVKAASVRGLAGEFLGQDVSTSYTTGAGPGIVNAPVAPDAIYVGIGGATPGLAVIDLNGFGQGTNGLDPDPLTGQPTKNPASTNYARNPNIGQGGVIPSLSIGTGPLDAGSNGPLTWVEDTRGQVRLLSAPAIGAVTDIQLGVPLDMVFNNSNINVNAGGQNQVNPLTAVAVEVGNTITSAPHPNPPKLRFPPPNPAYAIFGEEPTVTTSMPPPNQPGVVVTMTPPCLATAANQLTENIPGFNRHAIMGVFYGPQTAPNGAPPPPRNCPFTSRQQIGHFGFVLDRESRRVLVINTNRFTILDSIRLPDPVAMSMSPTLGVLAVANFSSSRVTFIDTDPRNPTFLSVIGETLVPDGPSQIAWQPDGESVLATGRNANTLTILSGSDFSITSVVSGGINNPIDLAVSERFVGHGNQSGLYYAYILNGNGTIAIYESGPNGVNGIGFDDMIGLASASFRRATRIKLDYVSSLGGFWVTHTDESGVGVVSNVELTSTPTGRLPTQQLSAGFILPPTFRQKEWTVTRAIGGSSPSLPGNQRLSGNTPVDVAFDEVLNYGALPNQLTPYNGQSGISIIGHSSKGRAILSPNGAIVVPYVPKYMFIALQDVGKIDVFDVNTRSKVRTLDSPAVNVLSGWWKQ